jgi:hypothetical protein
MKFEDEQQKKMFLKDEKYFVSNDNYCLGSNLTEAGEVFRQIIKERRTRKTQIKKTAAG